MVGYRPFGLARAWSALVWRGWSGSDVADRCSEAGFSQVRRALAAYCADVMPLRGWVRQSLVAPVAVSFGAVRSGFLKLGEKQTQIK